MYDARPSPQQERSLRSIDAIVDAAEHLIDVRGQVTLSAHELAAAAGISVGRVYYWFPDMPSVVAALCDRGIQRLEQHFADALDLSESATERGEFVHRLGELVAEFFGANPALVVLCLSGGSLEDHGASIRAAVHDLAAGVFANRAPHLDREVHRRLGVDATSIMLSMVREGQRRGSLDGVAESIALVMGGWVAAVVGQRVTE
ncbi:MAG: TetR/AcrR family transcriptional regulator [Ilumatobacteraceae bacterium]